MVRVPPGAEKYLQYLPTIAGFIRSGQPVTPAQVGLLKMFAPDAYRTLRGLPFENLASVIRPYANDPEYGGYVRLVLSPQGEKWVRDALRKLA